MVEPRLCGPHDSVDMWTSGTLNSRFEMLTDSICKVYWVEPISVIYRKHVFSSLSARAIRENLIVSFTIKEKKIYIRSERNGGFRRILHYWHVKHGVDEDIENAVPKRYPSGTLVVAVP